MVSLEWDFGGAKGESTKTLRFNHGGFSDSNELDFSKPAIEVASITFGTANSQMDVKLLGNTIYGEAPAYLGASEGSSAKAWTIGTAVTVVGVIGVVYIFGIHLFKDRGGDIIRQPPSN